MKSLVFLQNAKGLFYTAYSHSHQGESSKPQEENESQKGDGSKPQEDEQIIPTHVQEIGSIQQTKPVQCTQQRYETQKQQSQKWYRIHNIEFVQSDTEAITKNEWLNDQHMLVALVLIKQQHPNTLSLV